MPDKEQNKELPRLTYSNTDIDLSGIHALFDRDLPVFQKEQLGRLHANYIGGKASEDGAPYDVLAPHDDRIVLGKLIAASPAAVAEAVASARKTQHGWDALGMAGRIVQLRRAADHIAAYRFDIGMGMMLEVGKSRIEAMGEVEEAVDMIRYYCDEAEKNNHWVKPLLTAGAESAQDMLRPFGVFAVIAPFNFPLALATSMITAALLLGNTVVFKPTVGAVFSGKALADAFAHLPDGVFNMICGDRDVGAALTQEDIDGVAFTGSRAVGMGLLRQFAAGEFMRPVIAELGGKNAAFVTRSADIDIAACGVARAAFGLSGQKCSACSKVYLHNDVLAEFTGKLIAATAALKLGDPMDAATFMGPVINADAGKRFADAIASVNSGVEGHIAYGGKRMASGMTGGMTGGLFDHGHYWQPTIVTGLAPGHDLNQRELFLPLVSVLGFDDLSAAITDSNATPYGLTSGLYTNDAVERDLYLNSIEAGVLYINRASAATTGAWPGYQGFCGWKGSGLSGKGGLGPHYLTQFGREQSRTVYGF